MERKIFTVYPTQSILFFAIGFPYVLQVTKKMDKCRVLIVDYIQADVDTLIEMLEGIDIEIKTANGGKEAIELVDSYKPHIVLLDLMMPLVNG